MKVKTQKDTGSAPISNRWLTLAGTYHMILGTVVEGEGPFGPVDGFNAKMTVLAGADSTTIGKECDLTFFSPDESRSEKSQEWASKKQTAFCTATGIMSFSTEDGEEVEIDISTAESRQVIVSLEVNKNSTANPPRLQLKFANLYHVDDPRAANAVKDEEALKLIPAAERKSADYFPKKQTNAEITAPAKTKLSADEMNDL